MALPGFRNHPKFRRLVAALRIPEAHVLGHVEMMWEVCYESGNAVLGDDVDVELAAGWVGEPGALCLALATCGGKTRSGLIEETSPGSGAYQVHDLADHAPRYVDGRRVRFEESGKDKTCGRCGTVFRSADVRAKFCSDTCRKADWKLRHQPVPETQGDAQVTDGDAEGRMATQGDAQVTDGDTITRPAQASPDQTSKRLKDTVAERRPRTPKVPSWALALPPEISAAAFEITDPWPHHKTDTQPSFDPKKAPQPVPHTSVPEVAQRLVEIVKEGGKLEICTAIAARAVREFRSEGKWIKACQHFFGKALDAPWRAYYQAEVTNRAMDTPEEPPPPKPRPSARGNGELGHIGEAAS